MLLAMGILLVPGLPSRGPSVAIAQDSMDRTTSALTEALRVRIGSLAHSARVGDEKIHSTVLVPEFYRGRGFHPAWTEQGDLSSSALELIGAINHATDHGLDPQDYHEAAIRSRLGNDGQTIRAEVGVDLELLLTDAFFVYGAHLVRGKTDPARLHADWKASRRTTNLVPLLESAVENRNVAATLASLAPPYPEYRRLQAGLRLYNRIEAAREAGETGASGGIRTDPAARSAETRTFLGSDWLGIGTGGKLEPGMRDPRVPALRERLRAEGYDTSIGARTAPVEESGEDGGWGRPDEEPTVDDRTSGDRTSDPRTLGDALPEASAGSDYYDEGLARAVREFQARNGLDPDGVIGPATMAGLARTRVGSIDRIRVNLERWRWLPERLGPNHVRVNIAEFRVRIFENDTEVRAIDCIVGKTARKSPVFSGRMTHLVINPTWTVPNGILVKDKLPLIRKDPGYLTANGFEVFAGWGPDAAAIDPYSVDWSRVGPGNLPYRIRQKSGPKNALGRIKFMFPNEYDVYLHDTPSRELFAKSERTFSSGCIRVQDPIGLAEYLLRDQPSWSRGQIEAAIAGGKERTVNLREPIPVHLLYWTSWADADGTVHFRKDVYERDEPVLRALDAPPPAEVG